MAYSVRWIIVIFSDGVISIKLVRKIPIGITVKENGTRKKSAQ